MLARWDPFAEPWGSIFPELASLHRRMDELTHRLLDSFGEPLFGWGRDVIPVDVLSRDGDLVIRAELPGIDPDKDVEVTVEDGRLRIRGERRREHTEEGSRYVRMERSYGAFERVIPLPEGVKESDIRATYDRGVLEVVVPGAGSRTGGGRKIPVEVGSGILRRALGRGKRSKAA